MKTAFDKIRAGLDDAIAFAEGETFRGVINVPAKVDVRAIRRMLHLKQEDFAARFGFGLARLRDWEQGRSSPDSAVRAYLTVIEKDPKAVERALGAAEDNLAEERLAG
ncbi:helix-turn-helix domain-containing protein [Mesorhizobium sp. STM 4661]|uniref:helix-turn-helix domain-containing protein n=1 Tax=Mesorhizobium sp. STM 4661 TaxID=1297570 RepID=UPI0002BEAF60|nr:helix-turn-helix domain-containing protein [Mesorhizobium sp. STM 4661]CCV16315.1 Transcriptional regulator, XRE family [Mesorhizobium sp. STM 4661]